MIKKNWPLIIILLLAFCLRFWRYEYFPIGGETADEFAWTLLGASLIQEKVPASWSFFSAYENYHYKEGIYNAPIVRPVFDHPPLFSFLPGIAHNIKSNWLDSPSLKVIRLPMVLLGTLNVGLFWFVSRRIFTKQSWAVVGTLLYATIPSLVFSSRLVVAENLLITWLLLALWACAGPKQRWTSWLLTVISAAAVLTKLTGILIPVGLITYGLLTKDRWIAKSGLLGGLIGLGLFASYGAFYNWTLFAQVFLSQSARELGLATLQNRLFLHPTLVLHRFFDGWQWLGLLAFSWLLMTKTSDQKWLPVKIMTVLGLVLVALTVGESTFHGWYDFVLWPLLVLSLTESWRQMLETGNTLWVGLSWLLLLPVARLALVMTGAYTTLSNMAVRGIVLLGFLPLGWQILNQQKLIKITLVALVILLLVANLTTIFTVNDVAYWEQAAFFELPR